MDDSRILSRIMAELDEGESPDSLRQLASALHEIDHRIRDSKDRAKKEIGAALLTIGRRNDRLNALALEVARRIGSIEIDHPELGRVESDASELLRDPELVQELIDRLVQETGDDEGR